MKKPTFSVELSEGFVFGLAIDGHEVQVGIIFFVFYFKFRN
jgi:hypothetical protein